MRDPNDTRDIGPRIGSPLWIYLTAVTVAGLGASWWRCCRLPGPGPAGAAGAAAVLGHRRAGPARRAQADRDPGQVRPRRRRRLGHLLLRRPAVLGFPGRRAAPGDHHADRRAVRAPGAVPGASSTSPSSPSAWPRRRRSSPPPTSTPRRPGPGSRPGASWARSAWPRPPTSPATSCWSAWPWRCTGGPRSWPRCARPCRTRPSSPWPCCPPRRWWSW